ncbi:MAG: hypothetical protein HN849_21985, partial [Victivallales bacterium]|nr:hypothetical protein [Victivallales bacterium]
MAVKYVCSECSRNWDADEYRDDLKCPECSGHLVAQDKPKGAAKPSSANPPIPNSPPAFKGLKVARPVGNLGTQRAANPPAPAAQAKAEVDTGETQSVPTSSLPSAELAQQMEALSAARMEQAEEAARLLVERAELNAEKRRRELIDQAEKDAVKLAQERAESHLVKLQAELDEQIKTIRTDRQQQAEAEAKAILDKAKKEASEAASKQVEETVGEAKRELEETEKKLRGAADRLKAKSTELTEKENALKERGDKATEAEANVRSAVDRIKAKKAELDKLNAEAAEAREKMAAEKQASDDRLRAAVDKIKVGRARIEAEKVAAEAKVKQASEKAEKRTKELADKEQKLREFAQKLKAERAEQAAQPTPQQPKPEDAPAKEQAGPDPAELTKLQAELTTAEEGEKSAKRDLEKLQQTQGKRQKTDEQSRKTAWSAANAAHHNQLLVLIPVTALGLSALFSASSLATHSRNAGIAFFVITILACWVTAWYYLKLRKAVDQLFSFFVKSAMANRTSAAPDTSAKLSRPQKPGNRTTGSAKIKAAKSSGARKGLKTDPKPGKGKVKSIGPADAKPKDAKTEDTKTEDTKTED